MITFKEYLEENSKPQKVAQFHGSDGTSVNVYARGDRHFAEITTKTGSYRDWETDRKSVV